MLCAFTVYFYKAYKSYLLILVASAALTDTLLQSCQVDGP